MGIPLNDVISTFSVERQKAIKIRTAGLIAEEMTLRQLREAMGKTQVQLAKRLGKPQAAISRIERQSDLLLSTLNEVMHALGGKVRVIAEFPDRKAILLSEFSEMSVAPKKQRAPQEPRARAEAKPASARRVRVAA